MTLQYLVDTNVVSETTKSRPDAHVLSWLGAQTQMILSAVGVYELARGIERTSGRKRRFLEEWLEALLGADVRVLSFDQTTALVAASIEQDARHSGRALPERDLFILATARQHGLRIATRNLTDFQGHGVSLYNPFDETHVS